LHHASQPGSHALCATCRKGLEASETLVEGSQRSIAQQPRLRLTATHILLLLNLLVYIAMGLPAHPPSHAQLVTWGFSWGPLTLGDQWWRVLTSIFVHDGLIHLLANLCCLWLIGRTAERILGSWSFVALFLLAGAAGETLTLAVNPEALSGGASGALFGVIGALLVNLPGKVVGRISWPKARFVLLLAFVFFSMYADAGDRSVNNIAHIGGLLTGLVLGVVLMRRSMEAAPMRKRAFACGLVVLVLFTVIVRYRNGYVVPLGAAVEAVDDNRLDDAARFANRVLEQHPQDPAANTLLGGIYIQKEEYKRAEPLLRAAVAADPQNRSALYLLGLVYLRTGRFDSTLDITTKLLKLRAVGEKERGLFADAVNAKGEFELAGDQYLSLDRYDEAINAFKSALKVDPANSRAKQGLIRAYRAKGMTSEANALEKNAP
jgi:membrane associated rhomboid family serine protease